MGTSILSCLIGLVCLGSPSTRDGLGGLTDKLTTMTSNAVTTPPEHTLRIEVRGVPSDRGHVLVALYTKESTWTKPEGAFATQKAKAHKGVTTVEFSDLPRGAYAIAVLHDADDNGKMTTSIIGIPKEAYGFGNDARATFSAPSFGESLVEIDGRTEIVVNVK